MRAALILAASMRPDVWLRCRPTPLGVAPSAVPKNTDSANPTLLQRLAEMRVAQNERTREERAKKEAKAMGKEMAKLQQQ